MSLVKWVAKFQNANVDASNYQMCDLDTSAAVSSEDEFAAQIIAYFASLAMQATDTSLVELSARAIGDPGFHSIAFPTTAYAAVAIAAAADSIGINAMSTGYASNLGGSGHALAPLGTSVSVSEKTATAGPTGRGRHFLPFITSNVVNSGGTLVSTYLQTTLDAYNYFIRGIKPDGSAATTPVVDLQPVVTNAAGSPTHAITTIKVQPVFSNLESRRR